MQNEVSCSSVSFMHHLCVCMTLGEQEREGGKGGRKEEEDVTEHTCTSHYKQQSAHLLGVEESHLSLLEAASSGSFLEGLTPQLSMQGSLGSEVIVGGSTLGVLESVLSNCA